MALLNENEDESVYSFLDEASIHFFRAVKTHYSRDTSVDVINALQPILGKDWSGRIIFNMMADRYSKITGLVIRINPNRDQLKINAIKTFRALTGSGLTEAKGAVEASYDRDIAFQLADKPSNQEGVSWDQHIQSLMRELENSGFRVEIFNPAIHSGLTNYSRRY